jgi:hypothetical protein
VTTVRAPIAILGTLLTAFRTRDHDGQLVRFELRRFPILPLDRVIHFLAMDGYVAGGIDPQADFVTADVDHRDLDVVPDHDGLIALSG